MNTEPAAIACFFLGTVGRLQREAVCVRRLLYQQDQGDQSLRLEMENNRKRSAYHTVAVLKLKPVSQKRTILELRIIYYKLYRAGRDHGFLRKIHQDFNFVASWYGGDYYSKNGCTDNYINLIDFAWFYAASCFHLGSTNVFN